MRRLLGDLRDRLDARRPCADDRNALGGKVDAVMVAEAKNRSAFWALCAYVLTGPAAVFYYLAVPAIRPQPAPTLTQQEVIDAFVAATRGPARGAP